MEPSNEILFESTDLPLTCFGFFEEMRNTKEYCDITFTVGDRRVSAHRIIVAAGIPYFRDKLPNKGELKDETEIALPEIEPETFESLIEFAYTRKVRINMENVKALLSAACRLQVSDVRKACCDYLADRLCLENVLSVRDFASNLDCSELLDDIEWYVSEYFEEVSELEEFLDLPFPFVKGVVKRDNLRTTREEKVFETIMKWVKKCPEERKDNLPELVSNVRWLSVDVKYLSFDVGKDELIRTSIPCRDVLDEVKNHHIFQDFNEAITSFPSQPRWLNESIKVSSEKKKGCIYSAGTKLLFYIRCLTGSASKWNELSPMHRVLYFESNVELCSTMYYFYGNIALEVDVEKKSCIFSQGRAAVGSRAAALDNKIYLCGGSDGVSALKRVDCFDVKNGQWTNMPGIHTCREYPGVAVLAHSIYVFGGKDGSSVHNSVERFDFAARKWRLKLPMRTKRYAPACFALNGKIYVCGGITSATDEECVPTAEVFDPLGNQWKFITPMKRPRCHFQLRALDGKLYALPGKDEDIGEIYTPDIDSWALMEKKQIPQQIGTRGLTFHQKSMNGSFSFGFGSPAL